MLGGTGNCRLSVCPLGRLALDVIRGSRDQPADMGLEPESPTTSPRPRLGLSKRLSGVTTGGSLSDGCGDTTPAPPEQVYTNRWLHSNAPAAAIIIMTSATPMNQAVMSRWWTSYPTARPISL
jgi:hypothetical protein